MKTFLKNIGKFFKRNVYYVILFVCIAGIATMITLAAISGNNNTGNNNIIDNGNNNDNDDDDDVVTEPILFMAPVKNYTPGMEFSGNEFSYYLTLKEWRTHKGMDLKADSGTEVFACYDGTVEAVSNDPIKGSKIIIKHNDDLKSIYKSLSADLKVKEGDRILKGDLIGYVSDSMSTEYLEGPHLHFEVSFKNELINPMEYLETGDK